MTRVSWLREVPATCARAVRGLGAFGPLAVYTVVGPGVGAVVLGATAPVWFDPLRTTAPVACVAVVSTASVLLAGLSLVPTHAVSLVCGVLFGAWAGLAIATASIAGAALVGYLVLRRVVGERAVTALAVRPRAASVHRALLTGRRRLLWLVVLVRLSPVVPFAATNLVLAAAGVGPGVFLAGSVTGLLPRIAAVVVAGAGLAELDLTVAADLRLAVVGAVATVLVLVLMGRIARAALREVALDAPGPG